MGNLLDSLLRPQAALAGNVIGDADDNIVVRIDGDDAGEVAIGATLLTWDDATGTPQAKVSGDETDPGPLELWHNDKRALKASALGAILGNTTAVNQLVGGARFTVRSITGNVTLDTTTKDLIVFVDGVSERQITLPAPASGRTFILAVVGSTGPSVRRHGSEKINGAASNYAAPGSSIIVVTCDGTDWVARPITEPSGGTEEAAIVFSPVDTLRDNNADTPANPSGDQTSGTAFWVRSGDPVEITGIRFYWADTGNQVVKTVLYSAAGAVLKTANVTTAGLGVYTSTFSSPQSAQTGIQYKAAVYDTTGSGQRYTKVANNSASAGIVPARPFFGGRRIGWINLGLWLAGDNNPTSTASNEWYLVEPVLSE